MGKQIMDLRSKVDISNMKYETNESALHESNREIYKKRKLFLQQHCEADHSDDGLEENDLLYDDKYGLIYCPVPKVACTNWKKVWLVLMGHLNTDVLESVHHSFVHHTPITYPILRELSQSEQEMRLEKYFKFLFVRHPFERLLSAFRNKFELTDEWNVKFMTGYSAKIFKRFREGKWSRARIVQSPITFNEFVQFIIETVDDGALQNEHWRPIHEMCSVCDVHYDVIGKFENLEKDAQYILKESNVGEILTFPRHDSHITNSSTEENLKKYFSTISADSIHQLYKIYELDFKLFQYPYPVNYLIWSRQ
uniref:Carbohydrate sulfotransferase n=1 Tax=Saccoglossus kowalevskii TaxID=10224 RepID=A0ABM0MV53_SACKO|nr:PREDICTED: carbohydrate sulfotransferase 11-like [Saccoglossus kowalevskii]